MSTLYRHLRIPRTVAEIVTASSLPHREVVDEIHRLGRQVRAIRPTTTLDRAIRYQWDGPPPESVRPAPVAVVAAPVAEAEPVVEPVKPMRQAPCYARMWTGAKIVAAIRRLGASTADEIVAETGLAKETARHALRRMVDSGQLARSDGRSARVAALYTLGPR